MAKLAPFALAMILAPACWPVSGQAATDDVASLRAELERMRAEYGARVQALEARISQLESAAAAAPAAITAAPAAAPPAGKSSSATAFNPAISMILAGNYANLSEDPATYRVAGFIPPPSGTGPGTRSFNLGESELTVSSNVDPYFFANVTAAIHGDDSISVEEAFFKTLALSHGLTFKGGRFFSGTGYLNEIHAHAWDFVDQPLVYQVFFDGQRAQDGAQLRWVAPTDYFLEFGVETGSGDRFPGNQRNANALSGNALFAHLGGDVGDSTSWRLGVSGLEDHAADRAYADLDQFGGAVSNAFSGTSRTWMLDATLKWAPHGDPTQHQLKLQAEYLHRSENGQLAFDVIRRDLAGDYHSTPSGWYLQGVYEFMPRWRAGLRYDALQSGTPAIGLVQSGLLPLAAFPALAPASPERTTFMIDWSLSEFSRFRAQFAWDQARAAQTDHQLLLQYILAIGAHGAHKF
jgi:hypothetical protein